MSLVRIWEIRRKPKTFSVILPNADSLLLGCSVSYYILHFQRPSKVFNHLDSASLCRDSVLLKIKSMASTEHPNSKTHIFLENVFQACLPVRNGLYQRSWEILLIRTFWTIFSKIRSLIDPKYLQTCTCEVRFTNMRYLGREKRKQVTRTKYFCYRQWKSKVQFTAAQKCLCGIFCFVAPEYTDSNWSLFCYHYILDKRLGRGKVKFWYPFYLIWKGFFHISY